MFQQIDFAKPLVTADLFEGIERRPMKAVVLLSGGMDSCVAMAQARTDGADELIGVSIQYGSNHMQAETEAAVKIARWFDAQHIVKDLMIFGGSDSALMGRGDMPNKTYEELAQQEGPSPTVVPFRNANFLSIATTLAITRGAQFVYAGMHAEDAHNWAYPDCSPEFIGAMANAMYVGSYHEVRLVTPFTWMNKAEVCKRGLELNAPLHLTWSCYAPVQMPAVEGFLQCGKCPTCIERIEAFKKNYTIDPVRYFHTIQWPDCQAYTNYKAVRDVQHNS